LLSDFAADIVEQSKIAALDYGFMSLNAKAPLPMKAMATLVGPTGAGKTSLALTWGAYHARFDEKPAPSQGPTIHVLYELTSSQLAARRVAQASSYSWRQVLGGALSAVEIVSFLQGEHYYVVKPSRGMKVEEVIKRSLDAAQKRSPGTPLVIVDYLQRIRVDGRDRREQMELVVDSLVDATESRDMYTLLIARGSRSGSFRMRDGKSRGEELVDTASETSAIEAGSAATLVIAYENREGEDTLDARIVVAKARYGETGAEVGARFVGASGRWTELDSVPLSKGEREASERIVDAARGKPDGFDSATKLSEAAGGNKQANLAAIRRELRIGGGLERGPDQRIRAARRTP
jgi:replicative DNA helicase